MGFRNITNKMGWFNWGWHEVEICVVFGPTSGHDGAYCIFVGWFREDVTRMYRGGGEKGQALDTSRATTLRNEVNCCWLLVGVLCFSFGLFGLFVWFVLIHTAFFVSCW